MSRYLAAEVYEELAANGCELDDEFDIGTGWVSRSGQPFMLPEPDEIEGNHWFDADVLDDIFVNRWLAFDLRHLKRYPEPPVKAPSGP